MQFLIINSIIRGEVFNQPREQLFWGQHRTLPTTRGTTKQIFRNFDTFLGDSQSPARSLLTTEIQNSTVALLGDLSC